jgi:hypothetical protein
MRREGLDDLAEAERLVRDGEARVRQQLGMIVLLEQRGQAALAYDARKAAGCMEAEVRSCAASAGKRREGPEIAPAFA